MKQTDRQRWRSAWWTAVGVVAGAAAVWAVTVIFVPPRDVLAVSSFTTAVLTEGEVGTAITLNTVASWESKPAGTNQAVGTVTSIDVADGEEVTAGSVVYAVNLRPVSIAAGETPAFRDLTMGSKGADVQQLQAFLAATGYYEGAQDGEFGALTRQAVKEWQETLEIEPDGVVRAGDLVFIPTLPARVSLDRELVFRGAQLNAGESVVSMLETEPVFTMPVSARQAASIPTGSLVEVSADDAQWHARVVGQAPAPESTDQVVLSLGPSDEGGRVCADDCDRVPVGAETLLPSRVITQETVVGVRAPVAALLTDAEGRLSVVDADGRPHEVTVIASANGFAVVEGVPAGLRVRVPASDEAVSGGKTKR